MVLLDADTLEGYLNRTVTPEELDERVRETDPDDESEEDSEEDSDGYFDGGLEEDGSEEEEVVDDYVEPTIEEKASETKLVNRTKWADEDIFSLVRTVMDNTGSFDKVKRITVRSGQGAGKKDPVKQFSGYCYPRWKTITIRVPTTGFVATRIGSDGRRERFRDDMVFNSEYFAKVLTHEIHHLLGMDHKDMLEWWDLDCSYAKGINVRNKRLKRMHDLMGGNVVSDL